MRTIKFHFDIFYSVNNHSIVGDILYQMIGLELLEISDADTHRLISEGNVKVSLDLSQM
jgi:hypothetical protein